MKAVRSEMMKQCDCRGTSSGPRILLAQKYDQATRQHSYAMKIVGMACDVCDKPWTVVAKDQG